MARRILAFLLAVWLLLLAVPAAASGGLPVMAGIEGQGEAEADPDIDPNMDEDFDAILVNAQFGAELPARSAILIDQETGRTLFEQNPDEKIPPASVTKIMTMLLVMEALESGKIKLGDMVTASDYASSMGGSQIWLKPGEKMSVDHLLKAVAISSANDASAALGEHIAGSNIAFVSMMNRRAKELGMDNTNFVNATGLDDEGHLTTARDISIMSRELLKHPEITQYTTIWMDNLRGGETALVNTNKLVRFYDGATGLKTGTTNGAGSCLSASATRDGLSLISVVMGCPSSNDRFASARGLLDFGFANYELVTPPAIEGGLEPVRIVRGVEDNVAPRRGGDEVFVIEKGKKNLIEQEITMVSDIEAPVEEGQVLGKAEVLLNGERLGEYKIVASKGVDRMTFKKAFKRLLFAMLGTSRGTVKAAPLADESSEAPKINNPGGNERAAPSEEAAEPCSCGIDKCYCKEIGDICGCTKKK